MHSIMHAQSDPHKGWTFFNLSPARYVAAAAGASLSLPASLLWSVTIWANGCTDVNIAAPGLGRRSELRGAPEPAARGPAMGAGSSAGAGRGLTAAGWRTPLQGLSADYHLHIRRWLRSAGCCALGRESRERRGRELRKGNLIRNPCLLTGQPADVCGPK